MTAPNSSAGVVYIGSGSAPTLSVALSRQRLYVGLAGSSSQTIDRLVMRRYGKLTPGSAATPKKKSNPYTPEGVRPSPSRLAPGGAMPRVPTRAVHGPKTVRHPVPTRSYAVRVAVVAPRAAAVTTTACPAPPTSARRASGRTGPAV